MSKNIGTKDRIIRVSLGLILVLAGLFSKSGTLILGGLFSLFEGLSSWCVVYQLLGINTCPVKKKSTIQGKKVVTLFIHGAAIFIVAVVMNLFANVVGWSTWYTFLQGSAKVLTFDNYVFLFFVYPLGLGMAGELANKLIRFR